MIKTSIFLQVSQGDPFALSAAESIQRIQQAYPQTVGITRTRANPQQIEPDDAPAYAGVLELWFLDPEHAQAVHADTAAITPLLSDQASVAHVISGHERVVLRTPDYHSGQRLKGVFPFRRKSGMTVRDFQAYWWQQHGPIAAQTEQALCYTQCHPFPWSYCSDDTGGPAFDGITQLYWRDRQAAVSAMQSRQMREDQSNDAKNFVDTDSVQLFLAIEETLLPV